MQRPSRHFSYPHHGTARSGTFSVEAYSVTDCIYGRKFDQRVEAGALQSRRGGPRQLCAGRAPAGATLARPANFCSHIAFFSSSSIGCATPKSIPSTAAARAPVPPTAWDVLQGAGAIRPRQNPAEPAALRHPAAWGRPGGVPPRGRPGRPARRPLDALELNLPGPGAGSAPNPGAQPLPPRGLLCGRRLVPVSRKWLMRAANRIAKCALARKSQSHCRAIAPPTCDSQRISAANEPSGPKRLEVCRGRCGQHGRGRRGRHSQVRHLLCGSSIPICLYLQP